jgi:hypothetical protein
MFVSSAKFSRIGAVTLINRGLLVDACTKGKLALPGDDSLLLFALNWRRSDPGSEKWVKLGLSSTLQTEILEDILPIIAPERKLTRNEVQELIGRLVNKINDMDLRPQWQVKEFDEGDHRPITGGVVDVQGYSWAIIRHTQFSTRPKEQLLRNLLYSIIAFALELGKLSDLRKCRECSRIFVIYDVRRKFCSRHCRITFNNNRRLKEGYFADPRNKNKARALLRRKLKER